MNILDIGAGQFPYFIRFGVPWQEADSYTWLDVSDTALVQAKAAIDDLAAAGNSAPEQPHWLLSDALSADLASGSYELVVLANVLSAPDHRRWDARSRELAVPGILREYRRPLLPPTSDTDPFYPERRALLDRAVSAVASGGELVVITDLIVYGEASYQKLLTELTERKELSGGPDEVESARIARLNEAKLVALGPYEDLGFRADVLTTPVVLRYKKK